MDYPKYTEIDGKLHRIAEDETTECGLAIPHGNGWVADPAGKVHCGKPDEHLAEPEPRPVPEVKVPKPKGKKT
jgi:hypothetical protein